MRSESKNSPVNFTNLIGGTVGNLVEWYDWYAYSTFSLYFAPVFFPKSDYTSQLLNSAAIFAVGFLMRPLGGWLFGALADKRGRKVAMTLSVLMMSFGSLLIASIPSYASIGLLAPIILLFARLLQGLSVGGEYGTSATYLSEVAGSKRRGFYSSFQYVTLIGGLLAALALQLLLQQFLSKEQLQDWGWRIPFVVGAGLAIVAFYMRRKLEETTFFKDEKESVKSRGSLKLLLKQNPKAVMVVVGLTLGGTLAFYTFSTYMQKFMVTTMHLSKERATELTFLLMLIFAVIQPVFGWLSDLYGRKPMLIFFGIGGSLCTVPILTALTYTTNQLTAFVLILSALIFVSGYTSINAVVKAEMFPAPVRALGVGFPYAITVAVFGGTAEYLALWFKDAGHEQYYYYYVAACVTVSLLVYVFMNDSKASSIIDREERG